MLHQRLHLFLLVWPVNVACWIDTAQKPVHQVLISICDRKYARVPVCLFTYRHFHIDPVFLRIFPTGFGSLLGSLIHLDLQSRYFPAYCCTVALPSCGQLKECICEGVRVSWDQMQLEVHWHAKYSQTEMCSWDCCIALPAVLLAQGPLLGNTQFLD